MPWAIITRAASRATRNEPLAITSCWRSQSLLGRLEQRLGDRQPGVVDDEVDAAERQHGLGEGGGDLLGVGDVDGDRRRRRRCRRARRRPRAAASASRSATTTQAPSAARRRAMARPMPEPAPVTRATRVGQRLRRRQALQLGLLQRPVLDAELLRLGDRRVRRDRLGAAHHVDGVDVELAGDPGRLLVGAEGEHADAGHEHDRRVGAAHRRRVRRRRGARSRRGSRRGRRRAARRRRATVSSSGAVAGRSSDERAHLGAQEVVGARRAERGQPAAASRRRRSRARRRCR